MSGFWGGVNPGGNVSIEPQAKGGGKGAPKGGPPGGGPGGGPACGGGPGGSWSPGGPGPLVDLLVVDPLAVAEVPPRTPSSILRTAKFPTPRRLARNPTT